MSAQGSYPAKPRLMGVINLSPDSKCEVYQTEEAILTRARRLRELGVDLIDLGAKSSTLEGSDIAAEEEADKLLKALRLLKEEGFEVSVDSWSPEVAERCAEAGADVLNDTSGSGADDIIAVAGRYRRRIVLNWVTGENPRLRCTVSPEDDLVGPMIAYFREKIATAERHGATDLILDPGMGFLKTRDDAEKTRVQLQVMKNLHRLRELGHPILTIAPLRDPYNPVTPSTMLLFYYTLQSGADYLRVHYPELLREIQEVVGWHEDADLPLAGSAAS